MPEKEVYAHYYYSSQGFLVMFSLRVWMYLYVWDDGFETGCYFLYGFWRFISLVRHWIIICFIIYIVYAFYTHLRNICVFIKQNKYTASEVTFPHCLITELGFALWWLVLDFVTTHPHTESGSRFNYRSPSNLRQLQSRALWLETFTPHNCTYLIPWAPVVAY